MNNQLPALACEDCGEIYENTLDVTLPDEQWLMIHPSGEGGVLCGGCMVKRATSLDGIIAARMILDFGTETCKWTKHSNDDVFWWKTTCGNAIPDWLAHEGSFCPYCGRKIEAIE